MGMDQIAYKLEQRGIATTVTNYLLWSSVADDAAAAYKSGKVRTIILVGILPARRLCRIWSIV